MVTKIQFVVLALLVCSVVCSPVVAQQEQTFIEFVTEHEQVLRFTYSDKKTKPEKIVEILNDIRANPKKYAKILQTHFLDDFDVGGYMYKSINLMTKEGRSAVLEAKQFLEKARPKPALKLDLGLSLSAYKHSKELAPINGYSHFGKSGSNAAKRAAEFSATGSEPRFYAENIWGSNRWNPERALLALIIDDGTPSRGNRANIFSDYQRVGLGLTSPNKEGGRYWLLTMVFTYDDYQSKKRAQLPKDLLKDSGL